MYFRLILSCRLIVCGPCFAFLSNVASRNDKLRFVNEDVGILEFICLLGWGMGESWIFVLCLYNVNDFLAGTPSQLFVLSC